MINLKNEKGSITVFVLASCLFFIGAVACTQIYMQSKQTAVEREYRQIKSNYETGENIDSVYEEINNQIKKENITSNEIIEENNLINNEI